MAFYLLPCTLGGNAILERGDQGRDKGLFPCCVDNVLHPEHHTLMYMKTSWESYREFSLAVRCPVVRKFEVDENTEVGCRAFG